MSAKVAKVAKVAKTPAEKIVSSAKSAPAKAGPRKLVALTHPKAHPDTPILEKTGTRFYEGSKRQASYELAAKLAGAQGGTTMKDLKKAAKEADLSSGRIRFAIACHPECFKVWSDGVVEFIGPSKKTKTKTLAAKTAKRPKAA